MKFFTYELLNFKDDGLVWKEREFEKNYKNKGQLLSQYYIVRNYSFENALCMEFRFNPTDAYSTDVINTKEKKKEKNPRKREQREPNLQFFAMYYNGYLFLSDNDKKNVVINFLSITYNLDNITAKNILKDIPEFIASTKVVNNIKIIAHKPDQLLLDDTYKSIHDSLSDIYGYDSKIVHSITIEGLFDIKNFDKHFKKCCGKVQFLKVVGRDDNNFETIFNKDSFNKAITLTKKYTKDNNGFIKAEEIFQDLKQQISVQLKV